MTLTEFQTLNKFEQSQINRQLGVVRDRPLKEQRAQDILESWIKNGPLLSEEAGKEIGNLYIKEILGLDPKNTNWNEIGDKLSEIKAGKDSVKKFWEGVNKVAPELATGQDLEYIINSETVGGDVGFQMIGEIVHGPHGYYHTTLCNIYNSARP